MIIDQPKSSSALAEEMIRGTVRPPKPGFSEPASGEAPVALLGARIVLGAGLIVVGCVGAWFVLATLYGVAHGQRLALIDQVVAHDVSTWTIRSESPAGVTTHQLPPQILTFAAWLLGLIMLMVGSGLSLGLVRAGTTLIEPELRRLARQLASELSMIRKGG